MPEYCSCGTELVPDALFCHKCGKATREIVVPETLAPVAAPPPPPEIAPTPVPQPAPLPLNFHNRVAMRIALLVAVIATLLSFLPYLNAIAAGYFAVFFYRRRTGYRLNMESGVRMGWITGLLMFGIMACLVSSAWFLFRTPGGLAVFQAQLKNAMDPRVQETMKILQNGGDFARFLLQTFVLTTLFSMAGGALGAKMVGRH